ncbi:hypothetical protein EON63_10470 [archaeon]|nr:MAG: hypothetical protein EON63_10470 [archaeon]
MAGGSLEGGREDSKNEALSNESTWNKHDELNTLYTYTYTYHINSHVSTHTHIHIYIYIYIAIHKHPHTHTHTLPLPAQLESSLGHRRYKLRLNEIQRQSLMIPYTVCELDQPQRSVFTGGMVAGGRVGVGGGLGELVGFADFQAILWLKVGVIACMVRLEKG